MDVIASDHIAPSRKALGSGRRTRDFTRNLIVADSIGRADLAPAWLHHSYRQYRQKITTPGFPCFYGQKAEVAGNLFYSFAHAEDWSSIPESLKTFANLRSPRVHDDSNFILFVEPELQEKSHEYYRDRLWAILNYLAANDDTPWPRRFSRNPEESDWEFTFSARQFFVVGASPTYIKRKSRNLGPGLVLLFQPRSAFSVLDNENHGKASIQKIRRRLQSFDDVPAHPDLGAYADPAFREWKQYFLPDDNVAPTSGCPFSASHTKD